DACSIWAVAAMPIWSDLILLILRRYSTSFGVSLIDRNLDGSTSGASAISSCGIIGAPCTDEMRSTRIRAVSCTAPKSRARNDQRNRGAEGLHETARVHHAARRRGGDVAARGAGAAAWLETPHLRAWVPLQDYAAMSNLVYHFQHGQLKPRHCREGKMSLRQILFSTVGAIGIAAMVIALPDPASAQQAAVQIDNDDIGGVVTGAIGPEAGVWVI